MAETPASSHEEPTDARKDQWRLGAEPRADPRATAAVPVPETVAGANAAELRLARPVYVVTVEHLSWMLVVAWTLLTRLLALGARPTDPEAARHALVALAISRDGLAALGASQPVHATWPDIAQGWIFAAAGPSDASSRIVVAMCGVLLVATALSMRPYLGRAGALALAAFLALSPSVTYFSLGGSPVVASIAFMMVAIVVAAGMTRRPSAIRATGLGCAIALWLSADPIGYPTAVAVALSLAIVGVINAMTVDHPRLRARVWWERRRPLVLITAAVAISLWVCLTTVFFTYPLMSVVAENVRTAFVPWREASGRAIFVLAPTMIFYEFAIVILAGISALAIGRRRTGFMRWLGVCSSINLAVLLFSGANRPDWLIAFLIWPAISAAIGFGWMFQSARWNSLRYFVAALAALTLYIQIATNFIHAAPNTSEAAWDRHALLFWSAPVTSVQTVRECARAEHAVANEKAITDATVAIPADAPQVAWYLRRFAPAPSPESVSIVVTLGKTVAGSTSGNPDSPEFGFEESWNPDFSKLTTLKAVRYFFTQRVWSDVQIRDLTIEITGARRAPSVAAPASSTSPPS